MLVPEITKWSVEHALPRYATAARVLGFAPPEAGDEDAAEGLVNKLFEITAQLDVPSLQKFGVKQELFDSSIAQMSVEAIASGSPANNPRVPNEAQVEGIYKQIWANGQ